MIVRGHIVKTFSEWTAFSATRSGCPLKSRQDIYPLIQAINFDVLFDLTKGPIDEDEFSKWHRHNAERLHKMRNEMPIGWTTKLINVYLKTRAYIANEGRPNLQDVIHPPIDNGLWDGIKEEFATKKPHIVKLTHTVSRIKGIASYKKYSQIIEGCRLAAEELDCKLIEVEQLWGATGKVEKDSGPPLSHMKLEWECPMCGTLIFGQSTTAMGEPFWYSGNLDIGTTFEYKGRPFVSSDCYQKILSHFKGQTVPLGASVTDPITGGLGEFVRDNCGHNLTPRHASHIAAVLRDHGHLTITGVKPVMLHFK